MTDAIEHPKTLRQRDLVLFTVSAILLPDILTSSASAGVSSIAWWLLLGLLFFFPMGLISAELGCSYPEQGGIYTWIRNAFGGRWASRVTYCYWVNMALWLPSMFILFAGVANRLFDLEASLTIQIGIAIAITWLTVAANVVALKIGKWIPNIGAISKFLLFGALIAGTWRFLSSHEVANAMTVETLTPSWGDGLQFIPAIIYGMLGFELASAGSAEMRNPRRDVPRAILWSGMIVLLLSVLGTFAVLATIPVAGINIVEGVIDVLALAFAGSAAGDALVLFLGVCFLFGIYSSCAAWSMGANRAAAEAAMEKELPAWFGIELPGNGSPVGAAALTGTVSTLALLSYGFMSGSNEDLFWSLFAFSSVLFMLPYLGMVLAFLRMRSVDGEHPRPFRVPGGRPGAWMSAMLCGSILIIAIALFMVTPGEGPQWAVIIGVVAALLLGELLVRTAEQSAGSSV
ncbi:APC family permease [Congregibacter litoralis]|uniref:Amino acid transporter n=1 Tax=Congregibacter litoralis KT71 TaxID=314285 RepID=A4AC66_9GAMM|nr:APC family permease [Congregibacter litoralis]EAQ96516.1 Amino acid transporter [Congregibacter litoralis KT71]